MFFLLFVVYLQDVDNKLQKVFDLPNEYQKSRVQVALKDSKNQFWFAIRDAGLLLFKNGKWNLLNEDSGLISSGVTSILESSDKSLWVAGLEGISHLIGSKWQKISLVNDIGIKSSRALIFSVNEDSNGHIWIGANGGAAVFKNGQWTKYTIKDGLQHTVVHDAIQDSDGKNWFATRKAGINTLKELEWNYYYSGRNARKLLLTEDNHIWVAAAPGVLEYTLEKWIEHKSDIKQTLFPQFEDQKKRIWFYDEQNKNIHIYENLKWKKILTGLEIDLLFNGNNGRIFILSKGTLYQYNS